MLPDGAPAAGGLENDAGACVAPPNPPKILDAGFAFSVFSASLPLLPKILPEDADVANMLEPPPAVEAGAPNDMVGFSPPMNLFIAQLLTEPSCRVRIKLPEQEALRLTIVR